MAPIKAIVTLTCCYMFFNRILLFCKPLLLPVLLTSFTLTYGQSTVRGKVTDAATKEPLPFSNVMINGEAGRSTITNIDGEFFFKGQDSISSITLSRVGYRSKTLTVTPANCNDLYISLDFLPSELEEIIISSPENPAHTIIKKVIANKERNDPENRASFSYLAYNKNIYDIRSKNPKDSIRIKKRLKGGHVFMLESITRRRYLRPGNSEETVLATRVSGLKDPLFAALTTDLQPFSFYRDEIEILNTHYLNPISNGSLSKYDFTMLDTLYSQADTLYLISYHPKKGKNFEGLKGILQINTRKYGIQDVIAQPSQTDMLDIRLQQHYTYTPEGYWFPSQLDFRLEFSQTLGKDRNLYVQGSSTIDSIAIGIPLKKQDFALEAVRLSPGAASRDSLYWNSYRKEKLSLSERTTYKVIDSIGKIARLDRTMDLLGSLTLGYIPAGIFDIDLKNSLIYNQYEQSRIGLSLYTNDKLFKKLRLGGFTGYGSRDGKWKYGAEALLTLSKDKAFQIGISYQDNLVETGMHSFRFPTPELIAIRPLIASQMDRIEQGSLNVGFRTLRYLKWVIGIRTARINPLYEDTFYDKGQYYKNYHNTEVSANLRFAFKEKFLTMFNQTFSQGTRFPIISLHYARGLKGIGKGSFNYNKIEVLLRHSFHTPSLGETSYGIAAGYIDRPLPYGLLFTGEGSFFSGYPFIMKHTFQTMRPYEFLSDRYLSLHTSHNFGSLLYKGGRFQPHISIHNNISWGDLGSRTNHQGIGLMTKNKIYTEAGLQLDNLLRMRLILGYMTFGTGIYYRYGAYAHPDLKDNLALKLTLNFIFK